MTDRPTEAMVAIAADDAAKAIANLANWGLAPDDPFPTEELQTVSVLMREQARWFCQIKPEKIDAIYQDVQKAAQKINVAKDDGDEPGDGNAEATLMRLEHQLFGSWRGTAATAVQDQVANIRVFFNEQLEHLFKLMKAMAALRQVVLRAREDFISVCEATVAAATEAATAGAEASDDFFVGVIDEVTGLIAGGTKGLLVRGIEEVVDLVFGGGKEEVRGTGSGDILNDWARATKRLRGQLASNMAVIQVALAEARLDIANDQSSLLEPLPPSTDVTSPDFSWKHYYMTDRGPDSDFGKDVNRERKEYQQARYLDTPITRKLAGG